MKNIYDMDELLHPVVLTERQKKIKRYELVCNLSCVAFVCSIVGILLFCLFAISYSGWFVLGILGCFVLIALFANLGGYMENKMLALEKIEKEK